MSFARGELSSGSTRGRALLGHELTHVAQQRAHGAGGDAPGALQRKPAPGPAPSGGGGGGGGGAAAPASAPASAGGGGAAGPAAPGGGGDVVMPPVPMDFSPAEEARLAAVGARAHAASDAKTDLPSSADETSAARGAVEEPASEVAARAQADFIAALGEEPQPDPGLTAMCTQLQQDIANKRPSSEQEIAKQNPQQQAQKVGESVNGQVQAGAEKAGAPVAKIDAPPAGQPTQQPTPIENPPADVPAPDVQAGQATPDAVPAKNVSLDADVKAQDEKLKGAGMETDAAKEAAKSGEGPLAEAQKAQGDLGALAKTAPEKVLAEQAAALAKANAGMTALQGQTVAALGHWRTTGITGDRGKQDRMVLTEHQKRDKASGDAKAIYSRASADVTALVKAMPDAIRGKWDAGIDTISTEFESSLNRVKGWLAERYADVGGFFNKLGDSVFGLPDWIVDDYTRAEAKFGKDACDLALDLSKTINGTLLAVDKIIQTAKQQIDDIFDALAKELPDWAAQQKASFDKDFASLRDNAHKQAADLQTDLRKNAFQSVQDARQKIQELRDATKSLIDQIEEAAEEFAKDPAKFIINGLLKLVNIPPDAFWAVVAKVQRVVDDIAKDPLTFANNLVAAIGQGFKLFFNNIGTHLFQGLIDWLFSALGDVGVQAPPDTSLKSMVTLFLQVMGITWPRIPQDHRQAHRRGQRRADREGLGPDLAAHRDGSGGRVRVDQGEAEPEDDPRRGHQRGEGLHHPDADREGRSEDHRHVQPGRRHRRGRCGHLRRPQVGLPERRPHLPPGRDRRERDGRHHVRQHGRRRQGHRERPDRPARPGHRVPGRPHRPRRSAAVDRRRHQGSAGRGRRDPRSGRRLPGGAGQGAAQGDGLGGKRTTRTKTRIRPLVT